MIKIRGLGPLGPRACRLEASFADLRELAPVRLVLIVGFCDLGELASNSQDSELGATQFELGRVNDGECVRNKLYGIKHTKQIRHTTSEPLPCGPATTY